MKSNSTSSKLLFKVVEVKSSCKCAGSYNRVAAREKFLYQ